MNFPPGTQVFILDAAGKSQLTGTVVASHDPDIGHQVFAQTEMRELVAKLESTGVLVVDAETEGIRQMHMGLQSGAKTRPTFAQALTHDLHKAIYTEVMRPRLQPREQPWFQKFNRRKK